MFDVEQVSYDSTNTNLLELYALVLSSRPLEKLQIGETRYKVRMSFQPKSSLL